MAVHEFVITNVIAVSELPRQLESGPTMARFDQADSYCKEE